MKRRDLKPKRRLTDAQVLGQAKANATKYQEKLARLRQAELNRA